jgi:glycosyltransferase involved in cell wall biosynthesis
MNVSEPRRRLVGAFINTHPAQCSIFESGAMVAGCLENSSLYDLHCTSLAEIDLDALRVGHLRSRSDAPPRRFPSRFDFWVFNWHFITMAGHLNPEVIAALDGLKFTIVLELAEQDPLVHVPENTFDGYLALDPLVVEGDGVFSFPRPLRGRALPGRPNRREVPLIGSFGFGTPGKGFELLIESVNREFERAKVRINVPRGDYIASDPALGQRYVDHIAEMCRRIAKPGIEVEFTDRFLTPGALIDWCHENDLNCFMYTRDQPGLSATTDQAILSGQPLLTLTNATFRHIHPYIPPYPQTTFKTAIEDSRAAVEAMQQDWSEATFRAKFERMLTVCGLPVEGIGQTPGRGSSPSVVTKRDKILVLHQVDGADGDILSYGTRFSNALARSATRDIVRKACDSVDAALVACFDHAPDVVIILDHPDEWFEGFAECCRSWRRFRLLHGRAIEGPNGPGQRPPLVPFHTNPIALSDSSSAWLFGFDDEVAPLHRWIQRITAETHVGRIVIEAAAWNHEPVLECLQRYGPVHRADGTGVGVEITTLPDEGVEIIGTFAADSFVVMRAGGDSTARTEAICALALCTERAVMIDAAAPLPSFGGSLLIFDTDSLKDRVEQALSARISAVRDFGEWAVTARWAPLLQGVGDHSPAVGSEVAAMVLLSGLDRLDDEAMIRGLCMSMLDREPAPIELDGHLHDLWAGASLTQIAATLSTEAAGRSMVARSEARRSLDPLTIYLRLWIERLLSLDDGEFVQVAYRATLGRDPEAGEMDVHRRLLDAGTPRLSMLHALGSCEEARHRVANRRRQGVIKFQANEAPGTLGSAWMHCASGLDRQAFVDMASRLCLGREAAPDWRDPRIDSPSERWGFLQSLFRSTEGSDWSAEALAMPASRRLAAMLAWVERQEITADLGIESRELDNAASPHATDSSSPVVERSEPAMALLRPVGTVTWVLLVPGTNAFVERLAAAAATVGGTMIRVRWNAQTRRLESTDSSLSNGQALDAELSSRGEWLIVPDGFAASGMDDGLPEVDVLMTAQSLGLNTACLFRGAGALESASATLASIACERYLQALLHADVVLPVSRRALDEVLDVFIDHQGCDEGAPLVKLALPNGGTEGDDDTWAVYWRKLRHLLDDVAERSGRIDAVHVLDRRRRVSTGSASALAEGFRNRGVLVHDMALDSKGLDMATTARDQPMFAGVSDWVVVDGPLPADDMAAISAFCGDAGARLALLAPTTGANADFGPYLWADRVFASSRDDFERLSEQLLQTRQRLPAAEERFGLVEDAAVRTGDARPRTRFRSGDKPLRLAVLTESGRDPRLETVGTAARQASVRAHPDLALVLKAAGPIDKAASERFETSSTFDVESANSIERALSADVVLIIGGSGFMRAMADAAAWRGIPAIVAVASDRGLLPGAISIDLDQPAEVIADALVRALDDGWLRALRAEASRRVVRDDQDRADEILASLAADDPFRQLRPIRHSARPNIYQRLPALKPRPLLSVCISTYNRAGWLALNLRNLISQLGPATNDVEVVVVDNAATDETPQVVQPYLDRPDFRYYRNHRNVGMLGNLAVTAQRASGRYVWIIGDDDLTQPDAIPAIVAALRAHPGLAMVYLNYGYTSVADPSSVEDIPAHLRTFNVLEPEGPDTLKTVASIAANNENFYTAIYACVFQRAHALRAFCQDTSGRPFSTMLTCIPTAYYALWHMGNLPAYWIGKPLLVVNSNVSWAQYGPLFDLEQLPRAWDLAERAGAPSAEVDARRSNRLWLIEMMWRDIFENDVAANGPWFSARRVLTRIKHLPGIDSKIAELRAIYERAHERRHPSAETRPEILFAAWPPTSPTSS